MVDTLVDTETTISLYSQPWRMTYSNQDFDRAQVLARQLTDLDRANGNPAPAYGYSGVNFTLAEQIVRATKQ